jgi:hypothetical protein
MQAMAFEGSENHLRALSNVLSGSSPGEWFSLDGRGLELMQCTVCIFSTTVWNLAPGIFARAESFAEASISRGLR